ncbi:type II secretion system protein [Vibrio algivorus]|uniref:MSHA pilin protein MshA n=1 Tax=Vibrio algivorus TaxID=1667024 RepID=A0ABQ6ER65_9VIBR|nr:prepilin-type N-terminal cleavage/methylation domain-containing protein [Vibrio algivorus]GLT15065.1 MSHA pilin protein MshA [Vibrio algivorus]
MKKQGGFTLIELVVVIVILGILAVTAAPKFLNLQDDAKVSAVKGLSGGMKGAAGIVYGKAAIQGVDRSDTAVTVSSADGTEVETIYGYPTATADGIEAAVDGLPGDWSNMTTAAASVISGADAVAYGFTNFPCVAIYTQATDSAPATVTIANVDGEASDIQCELNPSN